MKKEVYEKPEIKSEESEISLHGVTELSGPPVPVVPGEQGCTVYPPQSNCP